MNEAKTRHEPEFQTSLGRDIPAFLGHWLRGRRGMLVLALAGAAVGVWLGWPTLVAAGLAPLILGVLPCVAMCALGLCMKGRAQSCDTGKVGADVPGVTQDRKSPRQFARREETES